MNNYMDTKGLIMAKKSQPELEKDMQKGTREKLLKAALKLFAAQGYDGTSTKQICDAVGANVAAVTYHFQTKENLLETIIEENSKHQDSIIVMILKEVHTVEELKIRIRMFSEAIIDTTNSNPDFHTLITHEAKKNMIAFETIKQNAESFHSMIIKFFKDAKKKRLLSENVDESMIAHVLFSVLIGFRFDGVIERLHPELDLKDSKKKEKYLDKFLQIFFEGIIK